MPPPMVQQPPYLYTDQPSIEHQLSAYGVKLRLNNSQSGYVSSDEQAAMTDALWEASDTINFYCWDKHSPVFLAQSAWVWRQCTKLGTYRICTLRANTVPQVVMDDASAAELILKDVQRHGKVPNCPLRRVFAPSWSNTRLVIWPYQFRCIRVERNQSSRYSPTQLPVNQDSYDSSNVDPTF